MEKLKVGDLVSCFYSFRTGSAYGKILKIYDLDNKSECIEYGPITTGRGSENSKIKVTVQILGYDMGDGYGINSLGEIVEVDDLERELDPHSIYSVITEEDVKSIKTEWELLMKNKLDFLFKNINRDIMSGRKYLDNLKLT